MVEEYMHSPRLCFLVRNNLWGLRYLWEAIGHDEEPWNPTKQLSMLALASRVIQIRAVKRPPALFFKAGPAPVSFFSRTSFPVFRILNFTIFKADIVNNLRRYPTLGGQAHAPSCSYIASCQTVPEVLLYFSSSFLNSWPDFQLTRGELGPLIDAKIDFQ